ncbi:MAG: tat pathway signal sequence domain protein [Hyphomicrobiales bacterium]|nr:tat pathway signal sequence domain protein [Hyphomicrobiales bacterium]
MTNRSPALTRLLLAVAALLMLAGTAGTAQAGPQYVTALHGYDAVAYFKDGKPVRGSTNATYYWNGATWLFSSKENRAAFIANPAKYAPQYDGYCAFAAARGLKAPGDPQAWKVHNGKLYLNVNANVAKRWEKDIDNEIKKADANWGKINPF